jgi:thymidine phosphorylase
MKTFWPWELEERLKEYCASTLVSLKNKADRRANSYSRAINKRLTQTYGLSLDRFNEMLTNQGGKCAVCKKKFGEGKGRGPRVDHCHHTGVVRGLLCNACNIAEGLLRNPRNVRRLLAYMEAHELFYKYESRLTQVSE